MTRTSRCSEGFSDLGAGARCGAPSIARPLRSRRARATRRPPIKEAAKQFEALFMQELMKSMREATMSSACSTTTAAKLGTEMLDSAVAPRKMTGLPGGLADVIARQLERQMGAAPRRPRARAAAANAALLPASARPGAARRACAAQPSAAASSSQQHRTPPRRAEARDRHPGGVHGRRRRRTRPAGASSEISNADGTHVVQPVRHQGRRRAGRARSPRSRPPNTSNGEAQKVTAKFRAYVELRRIVPRLRAADEGQPALPGGAGQRRQRARRSRRACSAPATPPIRPTPTSSAASSTPRCACSAR